MGIVRPIQDRPITDLSLLEANQDQYITRHLPDGRIIFADHRYEWQRLSALAILAMHVTKILSNQ